MALPPPPRSQPRFSSCENRIRSAGLFSCPRIIHVLLCLPYLNEICTMMSVPIPHRLSPTSPARLRAGEGAPSPVTLVKTKTVDPAPCLPPRATRKLKLQPPSLPSQPTVKVWVGAYW